MTILAGALLAVAVLTWQPRAPSARLRARAPARRAPLRMRLVPLLVAAVVLSTLAGALLGAERGLALGLSASASSAIVTWTLAHARRARRQARSRDQVARGCIELAALLRAGHPPGRALQVVAESVPLFAEPAAHVRVGGDLAEALQRAGARPGCHGLRGVAGAWRIAERTGASMTAFLDDLAAHLIAERDLRRSVDTELAAARMTGRLLAVLPLVGIGLGYAVGGDPVAYLTTSTPGLMCLAVGTAAAVAGVVWSEKLADRAGELR
ncbi:MAG TPA: type II secretion system F family protein [Micropruina sp.]|nr:type II secretion system F family protein [Micropruina sp.]